MEEGGDEAGAAPERRRALQLGLVQNPQDGSADTAISLTLSSSYITYSAAMLARLKDFFATKEVSHRVGCQSMAAHSKKWCFLHQTL